MAQSKNKNAALTENNQASEPKTDLTTAVYIQASIRDMFAAIRYEIKQHHAESLSKGTVLKVIDKVENALVHRYEDEHTADHKQEENDTEQPDNDTGSEPENTET